MDKFMQMMTDQTWTNQAVQPSLSVPAPQLALSPLLSCCEIGEKFSFHQSSLARGREEGGSAM